MGRGWDPLHQPDRPQGGLPQDRGLRALGVWDPLQQLPPTPKIIYHQWLVDLCLYMTDFPKKTLDDWAVLARKECKGKRIMRLWTRLVIVSLLSLNRIYYWRWFE